MPKKISVANLVMLAGAAVTLLFSFFDFYGSDGFGVSAWDTDALAFVSTIPALLAIAVLVWVICELTGVNLPEHVLTYNRAQLKGTWGLGAAGVMLAFLTVDAERAIGFWMMLLGSLAMGVGAVMALLGKGNDMVNLGGSSAGAASGRPGGPPPPFQGGGAPPPPPPPAV